MRILLVMPTKLPREEFYKQFARSADDTVISVNKAISNMVKNRPDLIRRIIPNVLWFYARTWRYQRVHRDYRSFLRDEEGLMNGPGTKRQLTWRDVRYPGAEDTGKPAATKGKETSNTLIPLRIPKRTWVDDVLDSRARQAESGITEQPVNTIGGAA